MIVLFLDMGKSILEIEWNLFRKELKCFLEFVDLVDNVGEVRVKLLNV